MAYEIVTRRVSGGDAPKPTISDRVRRVLQGISAYVLGPSSMPSLGDESVDQIREAFGGQLAMPVATQTRWTQQDLERAELRADQGDLSIAGAIMRSAQKDGIIAGTMSTRCGGLVRLPRRFRGRTEMVDKLQRGGDEARSIYDELCPPQELEALDQDGIELGVAVGELLDVPGRTHPVLCRLPPEHLRYRWSDNRWYYSSIAGLLPIEPGNGKWVLHIAGGRVYPWQRGLWRALGRSYITKEHSRLRRENWEMKLANPARVAVAPIGADAETRKGFFRKLMEWGMNTVFALPPGYDIKLVESNGTGHESFKDTIAEQNNEIVVCVNGQTVTTDGGAGFQNSDIHKAVRADLIMRDEAALTFTINTQILPVYAVREFGEDVLPDDSPTVEYDCTPPSDLTRTAASLKGAAEAITQLTDALSRAGLQLDVEAIATRFGVPLVASAAREVSVVPAVKDREAEKAAIRATLARLQS